MNQGQRFAIFRSHNNFPPLEARERSRWRTSALSPNRYYEIAARVRAMQGRVRCRGLGCGRSRRHSRRISRAWRSWLPPSALTHQALTEKASADVREQTRQRWASLERE
jgi:hypothetical protein